MHYFIILTATAAAFPALIAGHASAEIPVPRIWGRSIPDLKARNIYTRGEKSKRQSEDQCGAGFGSCAAGLCCSVEGYCGVGPDYCEAPDCQFQYGPACDANTRPAGTDTSGIARPLLGSIPYGGAGIDDCQVPGVVALTFDDGPGIYTNHILDILKEYNAKATFFVTGNNNAKGEIDNSVYGWDTIIRRAHNEGHQIASHTWSHQDLSLITSAQRKQQMIYNEMALRNILGFFPTYMRPPFSSCNAACEADLGALGYHIMYFDIDTDDYDQDSPNLIQNSKNWFSGNLTGSAASNDYLVISHDIHQQTAYNLTEYMLQTLQARGYQAVTVGDCLGDPAANWYRSSSGSTFSSVSSELSSAPTSTSAAPVVSASGISVDGSCGGSTGRTCAGSTFGSCCSQHGYCGASSDYCGTGCQPVFGVCGGDSSNPSVASMASRDLSSSSASTSSSTKPASTSASAPTTAVSTSTSSSAKTSASSAPSSPATSKTVSTDGSCGGKSGTTCQGSTFGNCCSQYGWCGSTAAYCSTGCQSSFGTC